MSENNIYVGKHLLVGLTYTDATGNVVKHVQTHGKITRIDSSGIFFEQANGAGEYSLPPDPSALILANPGEYRLRGTGEVVVDPDYISTWTIKAPAENREQAGEE